MNKDVIEITMCLFMNTNVDIWAVIFKSCFEKNAETRMLCLFKSAEYAAAFSSFFLLSC